MTTLGESFLKANPNHDERGRFASAGDALAATLHLKTDDETRRSVADLGRRIVGHMHDAAVDLAAKARHVVRSTSGGVAVKTAHTLPGNAGHIESHLQVQRYDLRDDRLQRAVSEQHVR
jgi:hypothetical protein